MNHDGRADLVRLKEFSATGFTGVNVAVLTIDQTGAAAFDEAQPFAVKRSRRLPSRAGEVALLNVSAARALRIRPDVILNAHIVTSPAATLLGKTLRAPVVQYLHAAEVGARPRLAAFGVRHAALTVAVSRHTEQLALAVGAMLTERPEAA